MAHVDARETPVSAQSPPPHSPPVQVIEVEKTSPNTKPGGEPVLVYRDPHLVHATKVRHVESVQHRLMAPMYPNRSRGHYLLGDYRPPPPPPPHLHPSLLTPQNYMEMLWQQQQRGSAPGHLATPWTHIYSESQMRTLATEVPTQRRIERFREEHERAERDRQEKERKEKERFEKEERERAQREAVQHHFDESLKLAKKRDLEKAFMNSIPKGPPLGRSSPMMTPSVQLEADPRERTKAIDAKDRIKEQERWCATQQRPESGLNFSHTENPRLSLPKNEKPQIPSNAKVREPSYNIYGYQPFQHTYIAQVPLKASPPNTQPLPDKRTAQRQERPTTPGRQKALPSKQSFPSERASPVYQPVVGGSGAFKPYEYPSPTPTNAQAPPAHQNTSSPSLVTRYTSQQDQPQNLVKGEPRPSSTNYSSKSATPPISATYTYSLIQKGVVPNPLYTSVKDQQYPRATSSSGITTGTPICRSSSISPQIRQTSYSNYRSSQQPDSGSNNRSLIPPRPSSHQSPSPAHMKTANTPPPIAPTSPHLANDTFPVHHPSPMPRISPVPSMGSPENQPLNLQNPTAGASKRKHSNKDQNNSIKPKKTKSSQDEMSMPPHLMPQYQLSNIPLSSPYPYSSSPPLSMIHLNANVPSNSSDFTPSPSLAEVPSASSPLPTMPTLTNSSEHSIIIPQPALSPSSESSTTDQVYYSKLDKGRNKLKSVTNNETPPPTIAQNEENLKPSIMPLIKSEINESLPVSSINYHPKLKKAWLQRHSENEDKKVDTSLVIKIETPVITKVSCREENVIPSPPPPCIKAEVPVILNGLEEKMNNYESSSSTSEGEKELKSHPKRKIKLTSKSWSGKKQKHAADFLQSEQNLLEDTSTSKKENEEKRKSSKESSSRKKRSRKSKNKHSSSDDSNKKKVVPLESTPKPTEKPSIAQLKKSGEPFLQDGACYDVAPRLPKCRECRMTPHQRNKKMPNIFCRFYAYRKLKYGKNGTIVNAGFSEPNDASDEDLKLWLPPTRENVPYNLDQKTCVYILAHIGDYFCNLVLQEKEAILLAKDKAISWKKVVQGVREQCDVCDTTLFNIHWVCHKCGFVVCIDCYKLRKQGSVKDENLAKDRDEYQWLLCSNRQPHEQDKLMTTQIIAGPSLWLLGQMIHESRNRWNVPAFCPCPKEEKHNNGINKKLINAVFKCLNSSVKDQVNGFQGKGGANGIKPLVSSHTQQTEEVGYSSESGGSPLNWLADLAIQQEEMNEESPFFSHSDDDDEKNENHSTLRELLIRPSSKGGGADKEPKVKKQDRKDKVNDINYIVKHYSLLKSLTELNFIHPSTLEDTYSSINHMWLCNGKLLLLNDPSNEKNLFAFQDTWRKGKPIVIANVNTHLNPSLWHPNTFVQQFGDVRNDLVNCKTGAIISDIPLRKFWEGFESLSKRLKDENGEPAMLKVKDWPPGDEFSEVLPAGFKDLMEGLPLHHYILRSGIFNMASRFPDLFARPDLGPRMYIAYGSPSSLVGSTSGLQMDVCDSVNVLVYVGQTKEDNEEPEEIARTLEADGCDSLKIRCLDKSAKLGALWHIYHAEDSDKIRDFLKKVGEERGEKTVPYRDPLYEQNWYLDNELRARLTKEYGVEPYSLVQCLGDAIFVPAGCPHQIHNLNSCIRISTDFVSVENTGLSLQLTQESRHSVDAPFIHDDKLQIKNLLYHAVKDAVGYLQSLDVGSNT